MEDSSITIEVQNLDQFYSSVLSKDPNVRLECFSKLENHLSDETNSIDCEDLTGFISGLLKWVESSNYRVGITVSCNLVNYKILYLDIL